MPSFKPALSSPECGEAELRSTPQAMAEIEPATIFHEPINMVGVRQHLEGKARPAVVGLVTT